jgi:microcystin-dependent protein
MYGGSTAPNGWLLCDGSAVSRTTYARLFSAIGTKYGSGNGSTTFNLPNFKGRVPVGLDSSQTEFNSLNKKGGSKYLQKHSHILGKSAGGGSETDWAFTVTNVSNAGNITTQNAGTGDSGNLQPYITVNYIISY